MKKTAQEALLQVRQALRPDLPACFTTDLQGRLLETSLGDQDLLLAWIPACEGRLPECTLLQVTRITEDLLQTT